MTTTRVPRPVGSVPKNVVMAVCAAAEPQRHDPAGNPPTRETYRRLADEVSGAVQEYIRDIKNGSFPSADESYEK